MKYENIPCAACGEAFRATDDVVVCPVCGAPHHRACWIRAGSCACSAQHSPDFAWVSPVQPAAPAENAAAEEAPRLKNGEGVVVCPNCSANNYENDIYCMRCGAKLHPQPEEERPHEYARREDPQESFDRQGFVEDFNRFGGLDPNAMVDGIPVCEYSDYVGGKSPGRIIRRIAVSERFGRSVAWIPSAFLFGPIWFFYRKMKKEGLLISLVLILLGACVGLLQINEPFIAFVKGAQEATFAMMSGQSTPEEYRDRLLTLEEEFQSVELTGSDAVKSRTSLFLQYALMLGSPLFCGLLGLKFYRKKAGADIRAIRGKCSDIGSYRAMLMREGGTSPGLAVVGVLLMLIVGFCMNYLPTMIAMMK